MIQITKWIELEFVEESNSWMLWDDYIGYPFDNYGEMMDCLYRIL